MFKNMKKLNLSVPKKCSDQINKICKKRQVGNRVSGHLEHMQYCEGKGDFRNIGKKNSVNEILSFTKLFHFPI